MSRLLKILLMGAVLAGASGVASAHDHVRFSISIGTPVYVEPAPVYYYYPRPVYYEPRPVYYEPRVVYYDRPVVVRQHDWDRGHPPGWYKHKHKHKRRHH